MPADKNSLEWSTTQEVFSIPEIVGNDEQQPFPLQLRALTPHPPPQPSILMIRTDHLEETKLSLEPDMRLYVRPTRCCITTRFTSHFRTVNRHYSTLYRLRDFRNALLPKGHSSPRTNNSHNFQLSPQPSCFIVLTTQSYEWTRPNQSTSNFHTERQFFSSS